jgi:hypothetical protein
VIACGFELKIHVDDMMCAVSIEFHRLVLANESASIPKNGPGVAQWIV